MSKEYSNLRQFIQHTTHTIFTRGAMLPLSLFTGVLVARYLGPEGKGSVAILMAPIGMICAFGESGIRPACAYLIGKEEYDLKDIQSSVMALFCLTAPIAFAAICIIYYGLGTFKYGLIVNLIFAATVPLVLLRRYSAGVLLGKKMITCMNYVEITNVSGVLIGILLFVVLFDLGLVGMGIAQLLGVALSLFLVLMTINKFTSLKARWVSPIPSQLIRRGSIYATSLFVLALNSQANIFLISILLSEKEVGIYSVGNSITELLKQVPLSVGVVLFSRSLSWNPTSAEKNFSNVLMMARIMIFLIIITAFILLVAAHYMIPLVYGSSFVGSRDVLALLLPGYVSFAIFLFLHFYAAGQGSPHMSLRGFLPSLLLVCVFSFLLIPEFGINGAAVASSFSYLFGFLLYFKHFRKKYPCRYTDVLILKTADIRYLWNVVQNIKI